MSGQMRAAIIET